MIKYIDDVDGLKRPIAAYSHAVVRDGLVFVAGQMPQLPDGEFVTGDVREQTTAVLDNLERVLLAAGSSLSDVLQATVYVTDLADFSKVNEVYSQRFPAAKPARATVQVAALVKGIAVEISAIAAVASES
jgi:2-iminobutanoate/2-iminopropanoate deaminase